MKNKTLKFYNEQASSLVERYNNANMFTLHQLLLKHIAKKSSVLDIGFGSGRDLQFLLDNDYDVWGIDPTESFLKKDFNKINLFLYSI